MYRERSRFREAHEELLACYLFPALGIIVLGDYGVVIDEPPQRTIGFVNAVYPLENEDPLTDNHNGLYAVVFEFPLVAVEPALELRAAAPST